MLTTSFLKIGRSVSSAWMFRLLFLSCKPFRLMYAQSFLVTSVRGSAPEPTTAASCSLGRIAFMNAGLGFRFAAVLFFAGFFAARRLAVDFLAFLDDLFLAAIASLPEDVGTERAFEGPNPTPIKVWSFSPTAIGYVPLEPTRHSEGTATGGILGEYGGPFVPAPTGSRSLGTRRRRCG